MKLIRPLQSFTQTIEMEHTIAVVSRLDGPVKDKAGVDAPGDAGGQVTDRSHNSEPAVDHEGEQTVVKLPEIDVVGRNERKMMTSLKHKQLEEGMTKANLEEKSPELQQRQ